MAYYSDFITNGKSKFPFYLWASIITHILLAVFLFFIHPPADMPSPVFSVDIVPPEERVALPEPEPIIPPAEKVARPPVRPQEIPVPPKPRPVPPEEELPPEKLEGRGSNIEGFKEGSTSSDSSVPSDETEDPDVQKSTRSDLSPSSEKDGLEPSGNGDAALLPRSSLFDKGTINKFASKGPPPKRGVTFDSAEFKHRGYMRLLKERIEGIWKYPKEAANHGISGDLYVLFTIKRDGKLAEVELLRTSGHSVLDEAVIKAIEKAFPFWPLPEDWEDDTLPIKAHFIYIYGSTLVL